MPGTRLSRSFGVVGPNKIDVYALPADRKMQGSTTSTDVREPFYYADDAQLGRLFWQTPDGSRWEAEEPARPAGRS